MQTAHSSSTSSTEGDSFSPQTVSVALDFSPEEVSSLKQDLTENKKPAEEMQAKEVKPQFCCLLRKLVC